MDWWKSLSVPTGVDWAYWVWAYLAQTVACLALWRIWRAFKRKDLTGELFWLYLALALAWQGDATNKWWFGFRRLLGSPKWMYDHAFIIVFSMLIIIGALIHIRVLTYQQSREGGWVAALAFAISGSWFLVR